MVAVLKSPLSDNKTPLATLGITPASRVIVVGLGVTGKSVVRYLLQHGIIPAIADNRKTPADLQQFKEDYLHQWSQIKMNTGVHGFDHLHTATHLVVSPGVALKQPEIVAARESGVEILSDIDLFAVEASAPILAITGSNGKTTVTTLVGKMLEYAGKTVSVGGNIGTPALDLLQSSEPDAYVLELSSFQLENARHLLPSASVVLNVSADHMDRYDTLADYARAKANVYKRADIVIDNFLQPSLSPLKIAHHKATKQRSFGLTDNRNCQFRITVIDDKEWLMAYDQPLIAVSEVAMQGRHNLANALAALALVDALKIPPLAVIDVLRTFSGLAHRMEMVGEFKAVRWINDSKATNIGACQAALQGMSGGVILIAGGDGKGADFAELIPLVDSTVSQLIVLGKDAEGITTALQSVVNIHQVSTIEQAVNLAAEMAEQGDTVLLSPACASLDQYENYQARGHAFKAAVMRLSA
jgi:UDP-N-acetylmuramoylalanine--D-glutamate ligase